MTDLKAKEVADSNNSSPKRSISIPALAIGAFALGAFAIGALAIGRLAIGKASIRRLEIDELIVRDLKILKSSDEENDQPQARDSVRKTD